MPCCCILQAIVLHLPNDPWTHPMNMFLELLNYCYNLTEIKLKRIQWFPLLAKLTTGATDKKSHYWQSSPPSDHCHRLAGIWSEIIAVYPFLFKTHVACGVVICFRMFYGTVGDRLLDRLLYWLMAVSIQPHVADSCATPLFPGVKLFFKTDRVWGGRGFTVVWSWW